MLFIRNRVTMTTVKGIWEFLSGRRIRKNNQEEARDWWVSNKPVKLTRKKNLEKVYREEDKETLMTRAETLQQAAI
jgi:hypothetical protein